MILGVDGISDFAALYSRKHDEEVQFYAFDMLAGEGDDLRPLPLSIRKANLDRLLARRSDGIFIAPLNRARSVLIYSGPRVAWGWKAWCQSIGIGHTGQVVRRIG